MSAIDGTPLLSADAIIILSTRQTCVGKRYRMRLLMTDLSHAHLPERVLAISGTPRCQTSTHRPLSNPDTRLATVVLISAARPMIRPTLRSDLITLVTSTLERCCNVVIQLRRCVHLTPAGTHVLIPRDVGGVRDALTIGNVLLPEARTSRRQFTIS